MIDHDTKPPVQLSPFVLWGQDDKNIFLKVELQSVDDPNVNLDENYIQFQSYGIGQHSNKKENYKFEFDFYDPIDVKKSMFKINDNCIEFLIKKQKPSLWPRLTLNKLRRAWLKVNFEKSCWNDSDDEQSIDKLRNEEIEFEDENSIDNLGKKLSKEDLEKYRNQMKPITRVEFSRRIYLMLYNLIQLYGSVFILTNLLIKYSKEVSNPSFINACRDIQNTINFLSYLRLFEILHQLFRFIFNKDATVWYHTLNRIFIFCILIENESRLITKPVTYYLVLLYAIYDISNYIYYILRLLEIESKLFNYLKCTIWIPLYPLIFLCEAVILMRSIPYYDETNRLSLELPNLLNWSFPFLFLLRVYLFFFFTPVMYFTMDKFYKYRLKKLKNSNDELIKKK